MNTQPKGSCHGYCRRAFTLVEVVASLMLLGTLLVSILVAHRRHVQQIRSADCRLAAVQAADGLLAKWSADGSWGATKNEGEFEGRTDFTWRWTITPAPELNRLGAAIGKLEVVGAERTPLCSVELLTSDVIETAK